MITNLRSIWVWVAVIILIIVWVPLLTVIRIFDRDPAIYRTGRWFRRLGAAMTRVNPAWKISLKGVPDPVIRRAMVVVSNHQSLADIPVISLLPWEMKWVGKRALFSLPFVGWMMKLSGDIPLERGDARSGARALVYAGRYLKHNCPVILFPEGTRSMDGRVGRFSDGPFHLAIASQVPVLPLVVDGSRDALPKKDWRFGDISKIRVVVLPEVPTAGLTRNDVPALRDRVRDMICAALAEGRGTSRASVDALLPGTGNQIA